MQLMEKITNLEELLRHVWNLLFRAAVQVRHPYHTPVLASTDGQVPNARTVVLRSTIVEERKLLFYTDMRSPKIADFQKKPTAALLFWDKNKSTQLRVSGKVVIHHKNDLAKEKWAIIATKNRKDYATQQAPGAVTQDISNHWDENELSLEMTDQFFDNFAVLEVLVNEIDYLLLSRVGHQRAKFVFENNVWEKDWITP